MLSIQPMADLEKKGGWLDWDGVHWPVNTCRQSLNPKYHFEYQEMGCGWGGGGG